MGGYLSDQEQMQLIKDWLKNYGSAIILAVLVFFAGNFGLAYWHKHKAEHAERASALYTQLLNSELQHKTNETQLFAKHLMQDYKNSPYASLAAFIIAKDAIHSDNDKQALQKLNWVIKSSPTKSFRQIARLRSARIFFSQNNSQQALTILTKIDDEAYLPAIYELKGDILLKMGNQQKAIIAYKNALNAENPNAAQSALLKLKIEQLTKI